MTFFGDTGMCSGSVIGAHSSDRSGRCVWCARQVEGPMPAPAGYARSDLTEAYDYFYDPDWGMPREDE